MYRLLRPLLFRLAPEAAHNAGMRAAGLGQRVPGLVGRLYRAPEADRLRQELWGTSDRAPLVFERPLGLAAGFDKNAERVPFWARLGFGFAEVGSVTALASAANPKPRAFRLPDDRALVNRMGLNNDGAEAVAARLAGLRARGLPPGFVLAVNVAKTHAPDILGEAGVADFRASVRALLPYADLLVLNVSCPNTAEGKTFEEPDALDGLLGAVMAERSEQGSDRPVLVKLSPPPASGLDAGAVDEAVSVCLGHGVGGFVASNTASDRAGCFTPAERLRDIGKGGLSGRPLAGRATALVRHLYRATDGRVPIVGVGGIDSAEAAYARIRAGASLVEVYTGLVYEGPGLVRRINRGLVRLMERDGFGSISEAVGADA